MDTAAITERVAMLHLVDVECGPRREKEHIDLYIELYGTGRLPRKYEEAMEKHYGTTDKRVMMKRAWRMKDVVVLCQNGDVEIVNQHTGKKLRKISKDLIMNEAREMLKMARRMAAGPDLRDALKLLKDLDELSDNIEDAVETFSLHFRVAGFGKLPTEVQSQFKLMDNAKRGSSAAKQAKREIEKIVAMFPEDKTAQRALNDADVMIARFERHEVQARKVVGQLSNKATPAALKKYASSVIRMLRGKVVDPKTITVKPWMQDNYEGVIYQMVVFAKTGGELTNHSGEPRVTLAEASYDRNPPGVSDGYRIEQKTAKQVVNDFLPKLKGWSGLKSEQGSNRAEIADNVMRGVNSALRDMGGQDIEKAEMQGKTRIGGSYRSWNLPKEGAYEEGEYRYREMVNDELAKFKKSVERYLKPYMNDIEEISYHDGEKSWIYIEVELR